MRSSKFFVAALAAAGAMSGLMSPAAAQVADKAQEANHIPMWQGEPGITETVEEIMARDARMGGGENAPRRIILGSSHNTGYDRGALTSPPGTPTSPYYPPNPKRNNIIRLDQIKTKKAPQTLGVSWNGPTLGEAGFIPPDSTGDVGPTQILVAANGRIKVYNKSGSLGGLNVTMDSFFNSVRNGSGISDPHVRYDRLSGRWFVVAINVASSNNRCVIAVSSGSTITNASSFTFFFFQQNTVAPAGDTGKFFDYPMVGVDRHALYIGANMFGGTVTTTGFVVNKASLLAGTMSAKAFRNIDGSGGNGLWSPQGVNNDDPNSTEGYFIGTKYNAFGSLVLRRITDPGGNPMISGNLQVNTATTGNPMPVSVLGSTGALDGLDERLFLARIRRDKISGTNTLVTAHNIEVNSSGQFSSTGNRNGSRWYELTNLTTTPTLLQQGTLFSNAATNPSSFWIPSVAKTGQGHMAIGSSNAGLAQRAEIATAGRLRTDAMATLQAPLVIQTTSSNYNVQSGTQRWGDYSVTSVDPTDDMTIWTFQEYCNANNSWCVRVSQLRAPAPAAIASLSPNTLNQGQTANINVTGNSVNGTEWFDPYSDFPNHIAAAFSGTGVTVNSITFNSPTSLTLNVSVSGGAATGARNLTITNPDGQAVTGNNVFTVGSGSSTQTATLNSYSVGPQGLEEGTNDVNKIKVDDGTRASATNTVVANSSIPAIRYNVFFTSPFLTVTKLEATVDAQVQFANVEQRIDFVSLANPNSVYQKDLFVYGSANTDVTRTAVVTNATELSDIVNPTTGAFEVRVRYRKVGVLPSNTFRGRVDFIKVDATN
ncbi:MAG: hypothetical protein HONBIEJF_02283 [Fimbriimonadaceae bacterium]|nr:hypothetical protein [Fimbriimonadaceae bacterium]